MTRTSRWPSGTGQWNNTKVMIVASNPRERDRLVRSWSEQFEVGVAHTPLELIYSLETDGRRISTVVIADVVGSVDARGLFEFLDAWYPSLRLITVDEATAPAADAFLDREMQSHTA